MIHLTATELLRSLQKGDVTSEDLTAAFLRSIQQRDGQISAFLTVNEEEALARARHTDAKRKNGEPLGSLAGLPVAVKDNICVRGQRTTCASKILDNFVPPYDAHVVTQLNDADAVLLGKTNLDEFAMGSSGENSGYEITRNPWHVDHISGGSSSGSVAAVAASEAPAALGSDTGGSIRLPASFCGVLGLKPTYGRVSRYGLVAYGSSLDQIGAVGRSVADAALMLKVIAGHDPRDSTSVGNRVPDYLASLQQPVKPLRIGLIKELFGEGIDAEVESIVKEAVRVYRDLGAEIREISLPHMDNAIAAYYIVATAEASSNLARYDGVHYGHRAEQYEGLIDMYTRSRGEAFGKEVKRRIMLGTFVLSSGYIDAYYLKALKVRRLIKEEFDRAFSQCDVLLSPTAPTAASKLGAVSDPLTMYLLDICMIGCNLAGTPGLSIPCGFTASQLPVGLHLVAPHFTEDKLLRVAQMYQDQTDWHTRRPAL